MIFRNIAISAAVLAALTPAAFAQDAGSLMRQADAAKAAGRTNDAVKLYEAAAQAYAKAGNQSAAADAFEKEANILIAQPAAPPAAGQFGTPNQPAQQVAVPRQQPAAPVQAKGAIPDGVYNCHGTGTNTMFAVIGRVAITGTSYVFYTENDREKLPGTYSWDGGAKIKWTSGFLNGKTDADWEFDTITKSNQLTVYTTPKGSPYAKALICYHSDMKAP